jgi:type II secretory ATPase GspE/PulE/Tfp pilus assembly ATPase PilB-like protein
VHAAKKNGMVSLKIDGLKKVIEGISTLSEVERVVG